ncbi:MAG: TonB-dependent receptor [Crocinitomicaceae bacterium]|nr:TonB-dependent receptor [Crocinitomicaceae bacterium]
MKNYLLNTNKILLLAVLFILVIAPSAFAQKGKTGMIYGKITNMNDKVAPESRITIIDLNISADADANGNYILMNIPFGTHQIEFSAAGYFPEIVTIDLKDQQTNINRSLSTPSKIMDQLEVFGERDKQPEKLDGISRLPLLPNEQIQSVSIISEKLIEQQGSLSIADATRNVAGIYTYATFGGVRESMSSRGFRGIPVLKNGVRIQTDFRGAGFSTDFSGVESIQIIKGANSISMGAASDLGAPGGIINIVTKTPKFTNSGAVSLRVGSFNQFRPTFDVQNVIGKDGKVAFRINGAYEKNRSFHNIQDIGQEKVYINPSLAWRPDNKTEIVLEMDHLNDTRSFDPGTVNLSIGNKENQIYEMPTDRFLGFVGNNAIQKTTTYTARFKRYITDKNNLYVRGAFYYADYNSDAIVSALSALPRVDSIDVNAMQVNLYKRSLARNSARRDKSSVTQFDLVGVKIKTGIFKHTFQTGIDYKTTHLTNSSYNSFVVDTINVMANVSNNLPAGLADFTLTSEAISMDRTIGLSAQEVLEIGKKVKLFGGVRFGTAQSSTPQGNQVVTSSFLNPIAGAMVNVWKGVNVFGSYTNSTNPRTAQNLDINGNALGNETINQIEGGIKSSWLKDRLRFNATYYVISNKGMNIQAALENPVTGAIELQTYYFQGGNDERKGLEVELVGRILPNLEVIIGYSYIDAQFKEHTTFVPGSSPNNTPKHTANAYVNYGFKNKTLRGLSVGASYFYLGARPYNDWTQSNVSFHGITPNLKPWDNKAYSLVNAQIAYDFKYAKNETLNNFDVRFLANNIFDAVGYDAYRTSYINRINPRNFAFSATYRF